MRDTKSRQSEGGNIGCKQRRRKEKSYKNAQINCTAKAERERERERNAKHMKEIKKAQTVQILSSQIQVALKMQLRQEERRK